MSVEFGLNHGHPNIITLDSMCAIFYEKDGKILMHSIHRKVDEYQMIYALSTAINKYLERIEARNEEGIGFNSETSEG
jgi:hypothetical protein